MQFSLDEFSKNSKSSKMDVRRAVKLASGKYKDDYAVQFFLRAYEHGLPAVKLKNGKSEPTKAKTEWAKKNLIKCVRIRERGLNYRR